MDAIIGQVIELFKCGGPPLCRYVQYHRNLKQNMAILRRKLEELDCQKEDIERRLSLERRMGKLPKAVVDNWLQSTQRITDEVRNIEQKLKEVKYFSRACLSELVVEKIEEVEQHNKNGNSFESLVIDAPPARGVELPVRNLFSEAAKKSVGEIWENLIGNEVMKIGVYGMGGTGKTTIITHINNKLLKETKKFENVIWVTVSQPLDLMKLQDQIATALKENLPRNEDKRIRAGNLFKMLEARKFVLILDDMWEAFQLEEVGIPEASKDNGCKLVITTRSLDVCRFMDCEVIAHVKPLPEDEALKLFLVHVGEKVLQSPTLGDIVKLVVKQCAGLPLAIVTVAGCMKGEYDIREWRHALEELSGNVIRVKDVETRVRMQLKFSYDRLKDEKVQQCFLYCALYPEDYKILKEELIDYWIAEGLVQERGSLEATYDHGHSILNRLVNNCLLESAGDGNRVKMHDLLRDMALHITSIGPLFMIKAGMKLREVPCEEEWKENLKKVSLMSNGITEISSNISPNCQVLSTLLLQRNPLTRIPESFFVNMQQVTVLDLSYTDVEELPNSITELTNLSQLLLQFCSRLQHVPCLEKLVRLRNLNLGNTGILEVPAGLEMVQSLRYLNLYSTSLDKLQAGMLSKLCGLQKLSIYWGSNSLKETVEEASRLSELNTFVGCFTDIHYFNMYVTSIENGNARPKMYKLLVRERPNKDFIFNIRRVGPKYSFPDEDTDRYVELNDLWKYDDYFVLPKDVQGLYLNSCEHVLCTEGGLLLNANCSDLKALWIEDCDEVEKLFSLEVTWLLQNLEVIEIMDCDRLEEIIALDDDEKGKGKSNTTTFTLPKLRKLILCRLPTLRRICSSNGVMVCDSLQEIQVYECPKLKRLPLSLPLPSIKKITVEEEWWESLDWDNPNAKAHLQPYRRRFGRELLGPIPEKSIRSH